MYGRAIRDRNAEGKLNRRARVYLYIVGHLPYKRVRRWQVAHCPREESETEILELGEMIKVRRINEWPVRRSRRRRGSQVFREDGIAIAA